MQAITLPKPVIDPTEFRSPNAYLVAETNSLRLEREWVSATDKCREKKHDVVWLPKPIGHFPPVCSLCTPFVCAFSFHIAAWWERVEKTGTTRRAIRLCTPHPAKTSRAHHILVSQRTFYRFYLTWEKRTQTAILLAHWLRPCATSEGQVNFKRIPTTRTRRKSPLRRFCRVLNFQTRLCCKAACFFQLYANRIAETSFHWYCWSTGRGYKKKRPAR